MEHKEKIFFPVLVILLILMLACCKKGEKMQINARDTEAQVVFESTFIAYITSDSRVYLITAENESGSYVPNIENACKIFGVTENYLVLFLETGCFQIYDVINHSFVSADEIEKELKEVELGQGTTGGYTFLLLFDFLLNVEKAEDVFCIGTDFAAVYHDGKWEGNHKDCKALQWDDIVKFAGMYEPDMGLRENGTVILREPTGDIDRQQQADQIKQWVNVVDIAEGAAYFGLLADGTVVTPRPSEGYASDVTGWTNICQIAAAPYITAGLTDTGRVLVRSPHRDEILQAQDWDNICYITANSFSVLGITTDGNFLITPTEACSVCPQNDMEYPLPGFMEKSITPPQAAGH